MLSQEWHGTKPVFSVCSGGLHPGIIGRIIKLLGKNIVIQVGGGVHGHPGGSHAGAMAVRQALDSISENGSDGEYAKTHEE